MRKYLMIHGFGHDRMGKDGNGAHGGVTMETLNEMLAAKAEQLGIQVDSFQSNEVEQVTERIRTASEEYDGILFNPASWVDSEPAIGEAFDACKIPSVEVHMGNICKTDNTYNVIAAHVTGLVTGFGETVYPMALALLEEHARRKM